MKEIRLYIDGMHCVNCANSIKKEALKIGANYARVDFLNKNAVFGLDDEIDVEKLIFAIKKLGFEVSKTNIKTKKNYEAAKLIALTFFSILCFQAQFYQAFFFASLAIILSLDFYKRVLFHRSFGMDLLVVLGISINYFYSFFSAHHFFFESTFVCFVIRLGKFIENKAKVKANSLIRPSKIGLVSLENGEKIKANKIKVNDVILIDYLEEIPVDGVVLNEGFVDESVISGESLPIYKNSGDKVFASSLNQGSLLRIKSSVDYYESSYERLKDEALKASSKQIKAFKIVDKISEIFVLVICIIAFLTYISWYFIQPEKAFFYASSVLLISCPCALGLAVPMVVAIAINLCFKEKIILKNPELISQIKDIECFVFDKTGTLCKAQQEFSHDLSKDDFRLIASIENTLKHPIARSICQNFDDFMPLFGKTWLENNILHYKDDEKYVKIIPENDEFLCYKNDVLMGKITLKNELNKDAKPLIMFLKSLKKKIMIISGDSENRVKSVAESLEISEYFYRQNPEQKAEIISQIKEKNIFIGDGLNDAKALRKADFGIAYGSVKNKADAILLENDLLKIKTLFEIFDKSYRKIKQNLFISFFYNFFGILLACGLFSDINLHLNPALCAMLMSISSLVVVFNSLLLFRQFKSKFP